VSLDPFLEARPQRKSRTLERVPTDQQSPSVLLPARYVAYEKPRAKTET
jgi:hypothetical protein